jgi:glycosyltransferase involved in cell wall biosynthesis
VNTIRAPAVAVLLSTYNGERHVAEQIESLRLNTTPFVLHWLDDQSTDRTRELVVAATARSNIELRAWHQPRHLGVPQSFFRLLECVEADVYLFCDQDDIWQEGKIDATVANLLPEIGSPTLCFSDSLMFYECGHGRLRRLSDVFTDKRFLREAQECRAFIPAWTPGHSQGFTRPLRDLFCVHAAVAREYASMHDYWIYHIAVAAGVARILAAAPVALYRQHSTSWRGKVGAIGGMLGAWQRVQQTRCQLARHARGFIIASTMLPQGGKRLADLLEVARLVAQLDRRQSPRFLLSLLRRDVRLLRCRIFHLLLAASLLCCPAPELDLRPDTA